MFRRALVRTAEEIGGVVFVALEHSARIMPESALYRLSRPIGRMLRPVSRRDHAVRMMKAILDRPGWGEDEWRHLFRRYADSVGRLMLEQMRWLRQPIADIKRRVRVDGADYVEQALGGSRGVVFVAAHTANFASMLVTVPTFGRETWGLGGQMPSWLADRSYGRFCRSIGLRRQKIQRGISAQLDALLSRGGVAVTFGDLTSVPRNNAWVPFGRAHIVVSLGPALLALRNNVALVPVISSGGPCGEHLVTFHAPLAAPRSGDRLRDAFLMSCQFMRLVTLETERAPEKWWNWDYGRFRDTDGREFTRRKDIEIYDFVDSSPSSHA